MGKKAWLLQLGKMEAVDSVGLFIAGLAKCGQKKHGCYNYEKMEAVDSVGLFISGLAECGQQSTIVSIRRKWKQYTQLDRLFPV